MSLPSTYVPGFHDLASVQKMPYRPLGETGYVVSTFSYGAAALGGIYESFDEDEAIETVRSALRHGVNYIDTAPWYGQGKSEERLGKALKDIPRQAFILATKVGRYELETSQMFDYTAKKTRDSVHQSLKLLGLDYIDIIQIHDVEFSHSLKQIVNHTIPTLLELKKEGKVKKIGLTSYNLRVLKKIIRLAPFKSIDVILSYCKCTLLTQHLLDEKYFFNERGIGILNASPTSMGLLTKNGPPAWHPASKEIIDVCQRASKYCTEQGFDIAHLAVHWSLSQNVDSTLISSPTFEILTNNLNLAFMPLSHEEKILLESLADKFFNDIVIDHWDVVHTLNYGIKMKGIKQNSDLE